MTPGEFTELFHNHDCEDVCDTLIGIMCFKCDVRHVCHCGGNVNHRQARLCACAVLKVETEKRPNKVDEIIYTESSQRAA